LVAATGTFGLLWGFFVVYLYARTDMLVAMTSAENPSTALSALGEGATDALHEEGEGESPHQEGAGDAVADAGAATGARGLEYWSRRAIEAKDLLQRVTSPTRQQLKDVAAIFRLASWMEQASEAYRALIELNATDPASSPEDHAFAHEQLGHVLQQGHEYEEADQQFASALRHTPSSSQLRYAQARNAALAGDPERARAILGALLTDRPSLAARARRDPLLRRHAEAWKAPA
jgi:tetratricopeptide (TPR) repeat protein